MPTPSPEEFPAFFGSLAPGGYCLLCLGDLYETVPTTVAQYLAVMREQVEQRHGACANCREELETFKFRRPA